MESNQPESGILKESCLLNNQNLHELNQLRKEQDLLDFTSMFKKNGLAKKSIPKFQKKTQNQTPNWLLQIPAKLHITAIDLEQRRFLNQQKWSMMQKVIQKSQQSLAAVISSVNYLWKQNLPQTYNPITFKQIHQKNQKNSNHQQKSIRQSILQYINLVSQNFQALKLKIQIHELYQEGKNVQFLNNLIKNLKNPKKAFIYVSYGQVLCPIGFDNTPLVPLDAYKKTEQIDPRQMQMWIICAGVLKSQGPFMIKRWEDIQMQMTSRWPQFLDLQEVKKGRQKLSQYQQQNSCKINQVSCCIEVTFVQNI